jgi:hypothetical protein
VAGRLLVRDEAGQLPFARFPFNPGSKEEIPLGQRQDPCRFARQVFAIGLDRVRLGVDLDPGQSVVEHHVALADAAAALDGFKTAMQAEIGQAAVAE